MINLDVLRGLVPKNVRSSIRPFITQFFPMNIVLWITFRCNYKCSYCPVVTKFDYGEVYGKDVEKTPEEWALALEKLPRSNIFIAGGEPFAYKSLPEFVNIQSKHFVSGIVTNGSAPTKIYGRIKKKLSLVLSFHPEFTTRQDFYIKIKELKELGQFELMVNIVATRENLPFIDLVRRDLVDHNVTLHVDPFIDPEMNFEYTNEELARLTGLLDLDRKDSLDRLNPRSYAPKRCSAGRDYINLMPNGDVFRCASGFDYVLSPLRKEILAEGPSAPYDVAVYRMGNIFSNNFSLDVNDIICTLPCPAACDRDRANISFF